MNPELFGLLTRYIPVQIADWIRQGSDDTEHDDRFNTALDNGLPPFVVDYYKRLIALFNNTPEDPNELFLLIGLALRIFEYTESEATDLARLTPAS